MKTLITGGSSGIGLELAKQFAKNKYDLILVARNQVKLESAKKELTSFGVEIKIIAKDVGKPGAARELYEITKKDNIDILVNDAGFGNFGSFVETNIENEKSMINLNITTLTELCKYFLPDMIARGSGKILNVASTASFQPGPFMAVYFATKAYVLSLSEALSEEVRGTGVTVTALCPGPTETNFAKRAQTEDEGLFKDGNYLPSSEVAKIGYEATITGRPVVIAGLKNNILIFLLRLTPRSLVSRIVGYLVRK